MLKSRHYYHHRCDDWQTTHSLPVQKLEASLASQVTTPRNSSGLPMRPIGLEEDHLASNSVRVSKNAAVILEANIWENSDQCVAYLV